MIAKLTGRLDSLGADHVVIDVGGVGYLVYVSARTLNGLGGVGTSVAVLVETQVREDAITLYGFSDAAERAWFRLLITVQGVGARVAQAVLGVLGPDDLVRALAAQDRTALLRADGVGPKLATRILSELKDKAGSIALGPAATAATGVHSKPSGASVPDGGARGDAVSALVNLGYGRSEAYAAVMAAESVQGAQTDVQNLLRQALKALGSQQTNRQGGDR